MIEAEPIREVLEGAIARARAIEEGEPATFLRANDVLRGGVGEVLETYSRSARSRAASSRPRTSRRC